MANPFRFQRKLKRFYAEIWIQSKLIHGTVSSLSDSLIFNIKNFNTVEIWCINSFHIMFSNFLMESASIKINLNWLKLMKLKHFLIT